MNADLPTLKSVNRVHLDRSVHIPTTDMEAIQAAASFSSEEPIKKDRLIKPADTYSGIALKL